MKFAKELEEDLVPEWRAKYFDYRLGKKKVKAVARALRSVNQTPKTPGRQKPANLFSIVPAQPSARDTRSGEVAADSRQYSLDPTSPISPHGSAHSDNGPSPRLQVKKTSTESKDNRKLPDESSPLAIPARTSQSIEDDSYSPWDSGAVTNYGSIVPSPPSQPVLFHPPSLELPGPALSPNEDSFARQNRAWRQSRLNPHSTPHSRKGDKTPGAAYEVDVTHIPSKPDSPFASKRRNVFDPRRTFSTPGGGSNIIRPPFLKRLFSTAGLESPRNTDVPLEAYKEFDSRQADFLKFLDKELDKIETFYRMKETEAGDRLRVLRQQLHEMRDRRLEEVLEAQRSKEHALREHQSFKLDNGEGASNDISIGHERSASSGLRWMQPLESAIGIGAPRFGKNTKALQRMGSPSGPIPQDIGGKGRMESWRDFTRRPTRHDDVSYRSAKRKLRLALQEFYRGLELLKSFALLNRTSFRKINKKYDKAVKARPTGRYMSEKVNKAWFVQSEVLEGQIVAVEDLYARYFERGNHKVAVGKLRTKHSRAGAHGGSIFRNGLLIAAGLVFGIQGVVYGADRLYNSNPTDKDQASYLLQIYGGYFLALLLFLLFCLNCRVWSKARINYVFIFEFDTRHNLDWHQLTELPSFLLFLLGLCCWLNFHPSSGGDIYLYWPIILIGMSVLILFFPGPILYHRSREWWAYSNFRLLLPGFYPVEFRDFFLGDMYCSQTYSMGNLELFICLYAEKWNDPARCNSSHSRLLGFLSTLPGIWRALQCVRRYYDTRNAFPHLVNCGKYTFTILFYMSLSLYRVHKVDSLRALFIAVATVNSVYCSVWDLAMDWSLCNPYAKHPFLRDVLGYKSPWVYYLAMVLDPILRFNWIFYAIYSNDLQHSALLSFLVGFSEVCRRGMWTLFRVENEHCTNVGRFRASRDVPLPYAIPSSETASLDEYQTPDTHSQIHPSPRPRHGLGRPDISQAATGADLESAQDDPISGSLRRRPIAQTGTTPVQRGMARVGTIMTQAHAQDFERKRKPGLEQRSSRYGEQQSDSGESTDENEEEGAEGDHVKRITTEDIIDAHEIIRRQRSPGP